MNDDAFSERLVEAAARSVQATCPRLVPSSTRDLQAADQRWFGLCAQLICLTRRANSALGSAHAGGHIDVQADPGARQLTLRYGDGWLIVKRMYAVSCNESWGFGSMSTRLFIKLFTNNAADQ